MIQFYIPFTLMLALALCPFLAKANDNCNDELVDILEKSAKYGSAEYTRLAGENSTNQLINLIESDCIDYTATSYGSRMLFDYPDIKNHPPFVLTCVDFDRSDVCRNMINKGADPNAQFDLTYRGKTKNRSVLSYARKVHGSKFSNKLEGTSDQLARIQAKAKLVKLESRSFLAKIRDKILRYNPETGKYAVTYKIDLSVGLADAGNGMFGNWDVDATANYQDYTGRITVDGFRNETRSELDTSLSVEKPLEITIPLTKRELRLLGWTRFAAEFNENEDKDLKVENYSGHAGVTVADILDGTYLNLDIKVGAGGEWVDTTRAGVMNSTTSMSILGSVHATGKVTERIRYTADIERRELVGEGSVTEFEFGLIYSIANKILKNPCGDIALKYRREKARYNSSLGGNNTIELISGEFQCQFDGP